MHERRVVDAVHPKGADEVPLEKPEGLGQEQRVEALGGYAIHHLAPELLGHRALEGLTADRALCARRDRAAGAMLRPPEALDMLARKHHGRVEANDREASRDAENRLDYLLTHLGLQVVQLRG